MKAPPLLAGIVLFMAAFPISLSAASDYFLKIPDIEGESTVKDRKGQIEIDSFSWGMEYIPDTAGGGGSGAGKVVIQDISIKKTLDKSTPKLMLACATGDPIPQADLILTKPNPKGTGDPVEYLKITMTNVLVTSYQTSGSGGGNSSGNTVPVDSFSLNFTSIHFKYTPYNRDTGDPEDSVEFHYDVSEPNT